MNIHKLAKLLEINDLPHYIRQVEQKLVLIASAAYPSLKEPTLRIVQSPGKRLRPALVIAVAAAAGKKIDETIIAAASAIELLHIASLVHDDIIDNAATRRGVETVSAREGISTAILVGDYLMALAGSQAANAGKEIAQVVTAAFAKMCEGQSQELVDAYNVNRKMTSYMTTIRNKTATLMAAACQVGGLCAAITPAEIEVFRSYGEAFGVAFQLIDDLLDILSTIKAAGKPIGNDIKAGVYTLPVLLSLKGPSREQVLSWLTPNSDAKPSPETIINVLSGDGSLQKTLLEAKNYSSIAGRILQNLNSYHDISRLSAFPNAYLKEAFNKQTALVSSTLLSA